MDIHLTYLSHFFYCFKIIMNSFVLLGSQSPVCIPYWLAVLCLNIKLLMLQYMQGDTVKVLLSCILVFLRNVSGVFFAFQINVSSTEDGLNFHDPGYRFEHLQILLVLLRSLPYASTSLQSRALQVLSCDILLCLDRRI